jgi:hypothetical protein
MKQVYLNGRPISLCKGYDIAEGWVQYLLPDPAPPTKEQLEAIALFPTMLRIKTGANGKPMDVFRYGTVEIKDV